MALFFVGVIEMIISAVWTRAVTQANAPMTGAITMVNIFIWFYVFQQVIDSIGDWGAIIPYAVGCAAGAMLGAVADTMVDRFKKYRRKVVRRRKRAAARSAIRVPKAAALSRSIYGSIR